jgi:hypothetical protein
MSEFEEDFYETHQWLPERLWCINKKGNGEDINP